MSFIILFAKWWDERGTGILGTATTIVSGLQALNGLIATENLVYWQAAGVILGALTIRRSNTNRRKIIHASKPTPKEPA